VIAAGAGGACLLAHAAAVGSGIDAVAGAVRAVVRPARHITAPARGRLVTVVIRVAARLIGAAVVARADAAVAGAVRAPLATGATVTTSAAIGVVATGEVAAGTIPARAARIFLKAVALVPAIVAVRCALEEAGREQADDERATE